jgi:protocatechuate 3,4-dioxygenase beta subunit
MSRRAFIRNTALCAVAVSVHGFVRPEGDHFTGDCETTSDILGPFYRPGSPVRNNLVIAGEPGARIELSGMIRHKDCVTPCKNAKVELWHCDGKGVYDNATDAFKYRGTTYADDKGRYAFQTILPVPYDAGGGLIRPAHFHLMITAEGYMPLVTQLYFSGDQNISKDAFASNPAAKNRILKTEQGKDGGQKVTYHVSMSRTLAAEPASLDKLTGIYVDEKDKNKTTELFSKDGFLWVKNEVYGQHFEYRGNNKFEYPALPPGFYTSLTFDIQPDGAVRMTMENLDERNIKESSVSIRRPR